MQHTAQDAPASVTTDEAEDPTATQPVRMLVPTRRRSPLFLTERNTLTASDLGITRFTTDEQLERIVHKHQISNNTITDLYVRQLRDGLAQPRDIEEAREWDLHIPINEYENSEETIDDPNLRLGWWWVYDLSRTETRAQRRARYELDERQVDTKGLGRLWCRAYLTVKGRKNKSDRARKIIANEDGILDNIVREYLLVNPLGNPDTIRREQIARAEKYLTKGTPVPVNSAGQSDLFSVWQGLDSGRDVGALNQWYTYERITQTGRPRGSRTRNRRTPTAS